jgi:hypothetical protein
MVDETSNSIQSTDQNASKLSKELKWRQWEKDLLRYKWGWLLYLLGFIFRSYMIVLLLFMSFKYLTCDVNFFSFVNSDRWLGVGFFVLAFFLLHNLFSKKVKSYVYPLWALWVPAIILFVIINNFFDEYGDPTLNLLTMIANFFLFRW